MGLRGHSAGAALCPTGQRGQSRPAGPGGHLQHRGGAAGADPDAAAGVVGARSGGGPRSAPHLAARHAARTAAAAPDRPPWLLRIEGRCSFRELV